MGIGGSIFLIALGAILAFAVNAHISGLDINVVGYVLMLAGLVGLLITLWYWNSRRRSTVVSQSQSRPAVRGDGAYVDEYRETRRDDVPPPPPPGY
jgi:membrane protein implicated in regulation of membrane protease activity